MNRKVQRNWICGTTQETGPWGNEMGEKLHRIAFQLRVRQGSEEAYDEAHRHVWPELLAELQACGVREYSIFRRNNELFLYMLVPDFQALIAALEHSQVDRRWQKMMEPLLERVSSLKQGEAFATMEEVFYMQGPANGGSGSVRFAEKGDHAG